MKYTVGYIRSQGIECRWTKNRNGAPIIVGTTDRVDRKGNPIWSVICGDMWKRAEAVGLKQAFHEYTALIDLLSVPA